jgi:hypothetical protein
MWVKHRTGERRRPSAVSRSTLTATATAVAFVLSLLAHEVAHALVALRSACTSSRRRRPPVRTPWRAT